MESEIFAVHFSSIPHPFLSKCMQRMQKCRELNLIRIFFMMDKSFGGSVYCDRRNVRSYLFFNWQKVEIQCAMTLIVLCVSCLMSSVTFTCRYFK